MRCAARRGVFSDSPSCTPAAPTADRRDVVAELTSKGFSTRAIAPIVGVSQITVRRDQQTQVRHNDAPDDQLTQVRDNHAPDDMPPSITGRDSEQDQVLAFLTPASASN